MNSEARRPFFERLRYVLLLGITGKLLVDTTVQMFNPFLTIIATGAGIGPVVLGRLVALRSLMGFSAPLLGGLADKTGYRRVIRASMLAVAAGMLLIAASGNLVVFAAAMVLAGLGMTGFTPNLHAYLSTRLPYKRRATGLAIVEYSWALAGILGLFLSGQLIEAFSWRAPFLLIGAVMVLMFFAYRTLPAMSRPKTVRPLSPGRARLLDLGENAASAWSNIALSGFNMFAMMHLMIIHGGWLAMEYGLGAGRLGAVALMLGFVDLTASVSVSLFSDRIGKKRAVLIGVCGMVVGFAILPLLNRGLYLALLGIAIPRLSFEFAVVSNFSLLSEQVPEQRGKVLSLGIAAGLLGLTIAGLTGPSAYLRLGVWGLGPVSAASALISLCLLLFVIKERM